MTNDGRSGSWCPSLALGTDAHSAWRRLPLPDRLPHGPLPVAGWGSWRAMQTWWEDLDESVADHVTQFIRGEKVDDQPGLGTAEVVDGEAAVAVILEVVMIGVDVRVWALARTQSRPPDATRAAAALRCWRA
jgi:hypothetical protein